jgi:hypothetical protein
MWHVPYEYVHTDHLVVSLLFIANQRCVLTSLMIIHLCSTSRLYNILRVFNL